MEQSSGPCSSSAFGLSSNLDTDMRVIMLAPHPNVSGPLNKHTPILVDHLRRLGFEVDIAAWGRHTDEEPLGRRFLSRLTDVVRLRDRVAGRGYDVMLVKTSHEW